MAIPSYPLCKAGLGILRRHVHMPALHRGLANMCRVESCCCELPYPEYQYKSLNWAPHPRLRVHRCASPCISYCIAPTLHVLYSQLIHPTPQTPATHLASPLRLGCFATASRLSRLLACTDKHNDNSAQLDPYLIGYFDAGACHTAHHNGQQHHPQHRPR